MFITLLFIPDLISQNNTCLPYELTEHRNYAMAPVIIEKEIIESCQSASNACQRLPRLVKYYNGTKFEVTIDVGICSGQCHGNTKCQSFDKKTKSISSANGKIRKIPYPQKVFFKIFFLSNHKAVVKDAFLKIALKTSMFSVL